MHSSVALRSKLRLSLLAWWLLTSAGCPESSGSPEYECSGAQELSLSWTSAGSSYCNTGSLLPNAIQVDSDGGLSATGCSFPEGSRLSEACQLVIPAIGGGAQCSSSSSYGYGSVKFSLYAEGLGPQLSGNEPIADNQATVHIATGDGCSAPYRVSVSRQIRSPQTSCEFVCVNYGDCVDNDVVCDGNPDCADGSDESDCPDSCGDASLGYQCSDDTCATRCDGSYECADGSDEDGCESNQVCEFSCGNGECVFLSQQCDGYTDCATGADERNCNSSCSTHLICDGRCVPPSWMCDGVYQCSDRADERTCNGCSLSEIDCGDGTCLDDRYLCNGIRECGTGADEQDCACSAGRFECSGKPCQPAAKRCDGISDCAGEDEVDCRCPTNTFDCVDACVPRSFRCNGFVDCNNGADESNCP
ncbi:MAG: LDL receptor domain-containing protein [Myxococcales bacterium]